CARESSIYVDLDSW
nr:immunoglobulin heavy chain junction region [Macaca mulatta]MOV91782.1 immunoglobulin heavy chain junction region [Macaca mulatta]